MAASKAGPLVLRSTSSVSLHERFSQVLVDQLTRSRLMTFDPAVLQQRRVHAPPQVELQTQGSAVKGRRTLRRSRSVWTRLGWRRPTRRRPAFTLAGYWSFRNKYRWRARCTSTCRRRTRLHLQGGGASAGRRRGQRKAVPTRKQLDAQLDEYMSLSKSRLDQQLEDYMSRSRSRLDAQLDEYMAMAGQTLWD